MPLVPWLLFVGLSLVAAAVNISSRLIEDPPGRRDFEVWELALWELSSTAVLIGLAPMVWRALRRWPPRPPWGQFALTHGLLTLPFSLVHVALMVAIREAGYVLQGGTYRFFGDGPALVLFYEWRKDALSYALMLLLFEAVHRFRQKPPVPGSEGTIALKVDGGVIHLRASEVRMATAAGNYVEFHIADGVRLARMTLAAAADLLGPGFVQVHRSRLVNRALIRAERPQPSGDVRLELADGSSVMASRRYRDRLPSARGLQQPAGAA